LEVPKNTNIGYRESPMAILGCGFRFPVGANRPRAFLSLLTNGVDELILVIQMATPPRELILKPLRTFAKRIKPHFDVAGDLQTQPEKTGDSGPLRQGVST
jgi:hypothetical protein